MKQPTIIWAKGSKNVSKEDRLWAENQSRMHFRNETMKSENNQAQTTAKKVAAI
jgi:hypothetical protein